MNQLKQRKKLIKDNVIMNGTSLFEKIIFFIINVLLTHYLSMEHFGEYSTALGFATFFSIFSTFGISSALIRAINLFPRKEREHLGNTFFIKSILSIIVYILLVSSAFLTNYPITTVYLIFILGLVRIGNEFMNSFYAFYNANERFSTIAIYTICFDISVLAITYIVIKLNGNYFHITLSRLSVVILVLMIMFYTTVKHTPARFTLRTVPEFFKSAVPFGIITILGNIIQRMNIIILSLIHGTIYSGIFYNGYIFIVSLLFIPINLDKVLLPQLYRLSIQKERDNYQFTFDKTGKLLGIISFYTSLVIILFGDIIIKTVFGTKYIPSINILKISSLALIFSFSASESIITSLDKQIARTKINFAAALINIISCTILGYFFKAEGIAVSMVITYFVLFLFFNSYLVINKFIKIKNYLIVFFKLIFINIFIYTANNLLNMEIHFILHLIIISSVYLLLVFFLIVEKDDIQIIKDLINKVQ